MRNVQSNFFIQDIFLALSFLEKKKKRIPDLSRASNSKNSNYVKDKD